MKSRISIAVVSLILLSTPRAFCGYSPGDIPANYYTFRIYDDSGLWEYDKEHYWRDPTLKNDVILNCELWQTITSSKISREDIHTVVYKLSHEDMRHISRLIDHPDNEDSLMQNQFVKWIVEHEDKETADFLSLAKQCEETRWELNSPWYYPTEGDDVSVALARIIEQAKSYRRTRLKDRYALQAIRAMFSASRYDELINFWNDRQTMFPDGLIKDMMKPYIAGAYFRTEGEEQAMRIYAECGDIRSLIFCADKQGKNIDEIEQMELVYQYCPDSPAFAREIQSLIRGYEYNKSHWNEEVWRNKCLRFYNLALKVIAEGKIADPAMWLYTAAFIADIKGDLQLASKFLSRAATARGSAFIKESIKVFQIYVDAKSYPYNAAYEQRLLGQLQWLDGKIRSNIDERVEDLTADFEFSRNISYYYWNDMFRKIALSVIVPRYIEQGNHVRAIQFANMADNRLLNLVDKYTDYFLDESSGIWEEKTITFTEHRKSTSEWNYFDYRNDLFNLIDSLGVDNLIAYSQRLKRPRSEFDRFLNERGYTNVDYFNEIIGTQCLREMRYSDAVKYFRQVPASFQYTLNVYKEGCLTRDPFANDCFRSRIADNSDYKYNFAREMLSLEQTIALTTDPNRKAQLQIRYAVGIRNSINDVWALTQYYQSDYGGDYEGYWTRNDDWKLASARSERLLKEAFAMFTDAESAALSYRFLGYNRKVVSEYPDTQTAAYIREHCDNLRDYKSE